VKELSCPICSADFPLNGDEKKGDQVFCSYCSAPFRITQNATAPDPELEEDF
jgi:uncharacterized Zn-finger protein